MTFDFNDTETFMRLNKFKPARRVEGRTMDDRKLNYFQRFLKENQYKSLRKYI